MTPLAIAGGLTLGVVIGIISGMIGIGGGAFLIPALIFFYGMSQKTAQGTSVEPCCCLLASSPFGLTTRPGMSI